MSTHPVENPRAETRAPRSRRTKRDGPRFPAALHEGGAPSLRRGDLGAALGRHQRRAGPAGLRAARHRGSEHLEPDRDEHRRLEVLPRPARLADRESSVRGLISRVVDTIRRWAEAQGYFATRRGPAGLLRRADATCSSSRRRPSTARSGSTSASRSTRRPRPASSTPSTTRWSRSSAWPRPRACSSSSARARAPTSRASAPPRSRWPAAAPPRARSPSCAATTPSPASSRAAARRAAPPRW